MVGDLGPEGLITTTAGGNANGLTYVASQLLNYGPDWTRNLWTLPISGTQEGKYRQNDDFDGTTPSGSSTTTIKGPAWSAALATAVNLELLRYSPAFYTIAINRAIESVYPWVYLPALDGTVTLTANDYHYTLPTTITPEMVSRVMVEGSSPFDAHPDPQNTREDYVFSPDGTEIWFGMRDPTRRYPFTTGKKLYIFARKYLTQLAADTTQGTIATDTTATVELVVNTRAYRLFLKAARMEMYSLLAGTAANPDRDLHVKMFQEARDDFNKNKVAMAMYPLPSGSSWE